jgi:hypothetical protein
MNFAEQGRIYIDRLKTRNRHPSKPTTVGTFESYLRNHVVPRISVAQWVRAAIHHHQIELNNLSKWSKVNKQRPEIIKLIDVPVARWSRAEQNTSKKTDSR